MNKSQTLRTSITIFLLACFAASQLWAANQVEGGFLRKKDFTVSFDSTRNFMRARVNPNKIDFDFSASGDTGMARSATGKSFTTPWKKKCTDTQINCDFLLTVTQHTNETGFKPKVGAELHLRITEIDSKNVAEISARIIQVDNRSKLEILMQAAIGDSVTVRNSSRKSEIYELPQNRQGFELKVSIETRLGNQKLSVYSRPVDGHFRMAQARIDLPKGFTADSIGCFITDSLGDSKTVLSNAYTGSKTWKYVSEQESDYLNKLAKGAFPGNDANYDYFGGAIFKLINSTEDSSGQFGTWENYMENTKNMLNASEAGYLLPIQIVRTTFHEKGPGGEMLETPFFFCTSPRREIEAESANLFVDPGFIYGDLQVKEVNVSEGKGTATLAVGGKMKIDFTEGIEKRVNLEIVFSDGSKAKTQITFRGAAKNRRPKN